MKRLLALLVLTGLLLVAAGVPAVAETPVPSLFEILESAGMTTPEAERFISLIAGFQGKNLSHASILSMIRSLAQTPSVSGFVTAGVYYDPVGYSFVVPDGWTVKDSTVGTAVVLTGPVDDSGGVLPSITIFSSRDAQGDFFALTDTEIENALQGALPGFHLVAIEDFELNGDPAREVVLMYGTEAQTIMQYQSHFSKDGAYFIITMTTLAEETVHDQVLGVYDTLVEGVRMDAGQGNG